MNRSGEARIRDAYASASDPTLDVEAILSGLMVLPPIEYDRRRKPIAEQLGIRVETLDSEVAKRRPLSAESPADATGSSLDEAWHVEPWPTAVDTGALLDDLCALFSRYLVLPSHGPEALALWTLHAWAHDAALTSPLLVFTSPEKRCGKTKALELLSYVVPRPTPTASVTPAALFRVVEKWHPTVIIDEADTFLVDDHELRGLLNSGHTRSTAWAIRTVGDDHEPRKFSTWAPKAIATIGRLKDTLTDRSIEISMIRKRPGEKIERVRADRLEEFEIVRRRAIRWVADVANDLRRADPDLPEDLNDRAADSWRPLLAIADRAGGRWSAAARCAASALSGVASATGDESVRATLLADVRNAFAELGPRIASSDLVARLVGMEERPWPEWMNGKPLSVRQLARLLRPFGIQPKTVRIGAGTLKGYDTDDFADAFARYLPSVTASQAAPGKDSQCSESVTPAMDVTLLSSRESRSDAGCDAVTDRAATARRDREVREYC